MNLSSLEAERQNGEVMRQHCRHSSRLTFAVVLSAQEVVGFSADMWLKLQQNQQSRATG